MGWRGLVARVAASPANGHQEVLRVLRHAERVLVQAATDLDREAAVQGDLLPRQRTALRQKAATIRAFLQDTTEEQQTNV